MGKKLEVMRERKGRNAGKKVGSDAGKKPEEMQEKCWK